MSQWQKHLPGIHAEGLRRSAGVQPSGCGSAATASPSSAPGWSL